MSAIKMNRANRRRNCMSKSIIELTIFRMTSASFRIVYPLNNSHTETTWLNSHIMLNGMEWNRKLYSVHAPSQCFTFCFSHFSTSCMALYVFMDFPQSRMIGVRTLFDSCWLIRIASIINYIGFGFGFAFLNIPLCVTIVASRLFHYQPIEGSKYRLCWKTIQLNACICNTHHTVKHACLYVLNL